MISIYSDGGSRGNPGAAAYGWLMFKDKDSLMAFDSRYMGIATNNAAEYQGIISALQFASKNTKLLGTKTKEINCFLDSELIVKQIKGEYRVKNASLKPLYTKLQSLSTEISEKTGIAVSFTHIPRAKNKHADKLVNITLDAASK